jgi:hypothetical protein
MSEIAKPIQYEDVVKFFARARKPEMGKPLMSWARIFKVEDNYEVRMAGTVVGVFTPDNKFTFTMTTQQARNCSITLSQAMHRALPFYWERKGTGRYEVLPTAGFHEWKAQNQEGYWWRFMRQRFDAGKSVEVFNGLQFDLTTYLPVNARPKITDAKVNQEQKLEWLRKLRQFKKAVKVRARMGVLESLMHQVEQERKGINKYQWQMPDWSSDQWQNLLYTSLKDEQCDSDMLKAFIKTASVGYWRGTITVTDVLKAVDSVFTQNSLALRQRFGVFEYDN